MSLSGPLRSSLSTYGKHNKLSLDGTVAGVEYSQYHGGVNGGRFDYLVALDSPDPADVYDPDPGRPEFPESDYQPYEWEMPLHLSPPPRTTLPEMPDPEVKRPLDYNDCLITDELFARAMCDANDQANAQRQIALDHDVPTPELMYSPQSLDDVLEGASASDPIQEIEQAIDRQAWPMGERSAMGWEQSRLELVLDPPFVGPFGTMGPLT